MQAQTVLHKMEEYVQDFRAQLRKHDPASLAALIDNTTAFFEGLRGAACVNGPLDNMVQSFRDCVAEFGNACTMNKMEAASQTLSRMEELVQKARKECNCE